MLHLSGAGINLRVGERQVFLVLERILGLAKAVPSGRDGIDLVRLGLQLIAASSQLYKRNRGFTGVGEQAEMGFLLFRMSAAAWRCSARPLGSMCLT